jgi:cell division septation protein DedD
VDPVEGSVSTSVTDTAAANVELHADAIPEIATAPAGEEIIQSALSTQTPSSYMVLIEQPATEDEARDLVDRLNAAGVSDFLVFKNGANKGFISLGVFSTRANATNRQQGLDQLGFTTFTVERYE